MPFRHISSDLKQRSLWLLAHGYTLEDTCQILGVSRSSVRQWGDNYEEYGHVVPPSNPNQKRPHLLDGERLHTLVELIEWSQEMYLDELQDWLALEHDILVAITTLDRNIREAGLTYKLLRRAAGERDEGARAAWRSRHAGQFHCWPFGARQTICHQSPVCEGRTLPGSALRTCSADSASVSELLMLNTADGFGRAGMRKRRRIGSAVASPPANLRYCVLRLPALTLAGQLHKEEEVQLHS
ncbi:hypothetical protein K439DRAFT_1661483 [Ramaria rubella]|nr:hypothetical protein K439DRAFT_1661483 [Ramaria rubella]